VSLLSRAHVNGNTGLELCVGLDPHPAVLAAWGCADSTQGLSQWSTVVLDEVLRARVAVVKPQVAFFERHGVLGMSALSNLIQGLREKSVVVIGDAKRGDIGSTMTGYAEAWLSPGSDFEVDALTLVPYQGVGALAPALDLAYAQDKGIFVLAGTSNPEAWATQSAVRADGHSVAGGVLSDLATFVAQQGADKHSLFGVVVGATVDQASLGINLRDHPAMPVLAPGYGAQGARLADVTKHFPHSDLTLPVAARSLLMSGPREFAQLYSQARAEMGG
jgi:orotidine-5'-phosphate decarboxylase